MLYFRLSSFAIIIAFALLLASRAAAITGMARTYPMVLIVAVVAGLSVLMAKEILQRAAVAGPLPGDVAKFNATPAPLRLRFLGFVAMWLVYPAVLDGIGFIAATTIAISVSFRLLRLGRIGYGILGAAAFSFGCSLLCATVFYIPLPPGPIDDWIGKMLFALSH